MSAAFQNTNKLYQGEFPPVDEIVENLGEVGAEPEYWGVRPAENEPHGFDRPYVYMRVLDQSLAFRIHEVALSALRSGYRWSLWAFFPGEAGLKTTAIDRQLGDLRYCFELSPSIPECAKQKGWSIYRAEASNFVIQALKEEFFRDGRKSGDSDGMAWDR